MEFLLVKRTSRDVGRAQRETSDGFAKSFWFRRYNATELRQRNRREIEIMHLSWYSIVLAYRGGDFLLFRLFAKVWLVLTEKYS